VPYLHALALNDSGGGGLLASSRWFFITLSKLANFDIDIDKIQSINLRVIWASGGCLSFRRQFRRALTHPSGANRLGLA
jgi:hypothetical protein